jgi:SAM-dependent methyltransferase/ribosomal protein L40E
MLARLGDLGPEGRILDIGSSGGSFPGADVCCSVVAIDEDPGAFEGPAPPESARRWRVLGQAERLPVASASIDVVVCSHSLEHFVGYGRALDEIGRVLKPDGRLYVSVPNGYALCDAIYRWVYEGGGHVNRFRRDDAIRQIETRAGVRLAEWKKLYSSFTYLHSGRRVGRLPLPDLPARLKRMARLPHVVAAAAHHGLYVGTRLLDRALGTGLALYGWAFWFDRGAGPAIELPADINVCMYCGAGHPPESAQRPGRLAWICASCQARNRFWFSWKGQTLPHPAGLGPNRTRL